MRWIGSKASSGSFRHEKDRPQAPVSGGFALTSKAQSPALWLEHPNQAQNGQAEADGAQHVITIGVKQGPHQ